MTTVDRAQPAPHRADRRGGPATSSWRRSSASPSASCSGRGTSSGRRSAAQPRLPVLRDSLYAIWLVPAVLAPLIVRKAGAAVFAEMVAAGVSAILGSQWGVDALVSGLVQGAGAELVFALVLYRVWSSPVLAARCGRARGRGVDPRLGPLLRGVSVELQLVRGVLMAVSAIVFVAGGSRAARAGAAPRRRAGGLPGLSGSAPGLAAPAHPGGGRGLHLRREPAAGVPRPRARGRAGGRAAGRRPVRLGQEHARARARRPAPERVPGGVAGLAPRRRQGRSPGTSPMAARSRARSRSLRQSRMPAPRPAVVTGGATSIGPGSSPPSGSFRATSCRRRGASPATSPGTAPAAGRRSRGRACSCPSRTDRRPAAASRFDLELEVSERRPRAPGVGECRARRPDRPGRRGLLAAAQAAKSLQHAGPAERPLEEHRAAGEGPSAEIAMTTARNLQRTSAAG